MDENVYSLIYFNRQKPDVYGCQERLCVKGEVQTLFPSGRHYQKKVFLRHCEEAEGRQSNPIPEIVSALRVSQ